MQKLVFINGAGNQIDLTAGNFGITNWSGLSNTGLNIQTQQVPFEDGGVFLDALMEQREIEVTVAIYDGNNLELRYQKKRELISALNPKLGEGTLIYTNNHLSRQIKAVPQIPLFENKNSNDAGTLKASVAFSCPSPYWEDLEDTIIQFTNDQFPIVKNDGDIKAQIKFELLGNKKNTVIKNLTSGKEITITGTEQKPLYLSTVVGQKEVYNGNEEYKQVKVYYDFYYDSLCYSNKTFYYYCLIGDKVTKSLDCEKWENINTIDYSVFNHFSRTKCVNDKIFVLGENGLILVSDNGTLFTQIASGVTTETIKDVIYANDKYLFLAENTKILQSEDLQNWNAITVPSNQRYIGIFYNAGIYFITGVFNSKTSTDLTTWAGNSRFVRSVENGLFFTNDEYSEDAINWTSLGFTTTTPVRYNKGIYFCGVNNVLKYSYDLVNWESINFSHTLAEAYVYNNLYFFITSVTSDARELLKGNNITNLSYVQKYPEHTIMKIATDTKRNLYIGVAGNYYAESKDLINWEYFYLGNVTLSYITYIPQKDVYILGDEESSSHIYISNDFRNWETVQVGSYRIYNIIYVDDWDLFILVSGNVGLATSADLRSWTTHFIGMYGDEHGLAYNKSLGVAVVAGTQVSVYSYNGLDWFGSGVYSNLACASSNTQPIIVAINQVTNGTEISMSTNGITKSSITVDYELTDIIFIEELQLFVAVGYGVFGITIDGVNWQFTETEILQRYYSLTYSVFEGTITIYSNGEGNSLLKIYYAKGDNKISSLAGNSDLSFGLDIGENQIVVENESEKIYCILKYLQKYIGV